MIEINCSCGGTQHITAKINEALQKGEHTAVIKGNWEIDQAVRIPSGFTLVLDGCYLKMADGCFSNLFVNEHHDTDLGRTKEGTDRDIVIIGQNGAVLDGGTYNGLSERTQMKDGYPPIWKNNLILFTNVDGFDISGISCRNQRWWAMNFVFCANGHISDIDFLANDTAVDPQGNLHHGLKHAANIMPVVCNADGIDIRMGCHDITIENITGFTEDDSVAITGLNWKLEQAFFVAGLPIDICRITVKNIATSAFCSNVRLLNQGEVKLYDITIDGVYDTSENSPHMDRGIYGVRIGDSHLYGSRHCTGDETYRITVKNVRSRSQYAIGLAGDIKDIQFENIECFDGAMLMDDRRGHTAMPS